MVRFLSASLMVELDPKGYETFDYFSDCCLFFDSATFGGTKQSLLHPMVAGLGSFYRGHYSMTHRGPNNGIDLPPIGRQSPIELFHPDGKVGYIHVIGNGPSMETTSEETLPEPASADLILLSPSLSELTKPGWWQVTKHTIDRLLAKDGLVYAFAPPILRRILMGRLKSVGFEIWNVFLHLPDSKRSQYLLPLRKYPAEYGLSHLFPSREWLHALFLLLIHAPGGAWLLGAIAPHTGFVAYRKASRKPFAWISPDPEKYPAPESVIITSSHRGTAASMIVQCFSTQPYPAYIAKLSAFVEFHERRSSESSILRSVGPAAHEAGAALPELLNEGTIASCQVLIESTLPGCSAAIILAKQPWRLSEVLDRLFEWLTRWNLLTCAKQPLDEKDIDLAILSPARQLAGSLKNGDEYLDWLTKSCSQIKQPLPMMSAHNDLTMWNVLLEAGSLGIVDWEEAQIEYFPLVDYFYALTDALLISGGAPSRQKACEAWLAPWGKLHHVARKYFSRFQDALALPQEYADLCLHACFLGHAMNELKRSTPGDTGPFVQTLDWLSLHCTETRGWLHG